MSAVLAEEYTETLAALSPNGRWLAYTSNETGADEVYVRPYPDVGEGGKWRISTSGGEEPRWRSDGRELFYRNGGAVVAVSVTTDSSFEYGEPQTLFTGSYWAFPTSRPNWDAHPDGQRFLMLESRSDVAVIVVQNALEEIRRLLPSP